MGERLVNEGFTSRGPRGRNTKTGILPMVGLETSCYDIGLMPTTARTCASFPRSRTRTIRGWAEASAADHFVQFFHTDDYLIECVAAYLAAGMRAGECGIAIVSSARVSRLRARLTQKGITSSYRGSLWIEDGDAILGQILQHGHIVREAFRTVVGRLVEEALAKSRPLRAFGEMVGTLWTNGNRVAAMELEACWNELHAARGFRLFCGYSAKSPENLTADAPNFATVCAAHNHTVVSAE